MDLDEVKRNFLWWVKYGRLTVIKCGPDEPIDYILTSKKYTVFAILKEPEKELTPEQSKIYKTLKDQGKYVVPFDNAELMEAIVYQIADGELPGSWVPM